jgi:hypothetical protein
MIQNLHSAIPTGKLISTWSQVDPNDIIWSIWCGNSYFKITLMLCNWISSEEKKRRHQIVSRTKHHAWDHEDKFDSLGDAKFTHHAEGRVDPKVNKSQNSFRFKLGLKFIKIGKNWPIFKLLQLFLRFSTFYKVKITFWKKLIYRFSFSESTCSGPWGFQNRKPFWLSSTSGSTRPSAWCVQSIYLVGFLFSIHAYV